ncbi:MAG: sigma-70 family RNA polymerase sigma factor [Prolixibacteraceae bacterium]|nr:sigma-70 family RNA polymerase sigma factor [Prolixibacteraceae bacterium]
MKNISIPLSHSYSKKYHKKDYSDNEILAGIISNENVIFSHIYKMYFIKIKPMVFSFRHTALDPEDIFQEGLTRAVMNIREGRFRGESSFFTYLNSICRNICLKELNKMKGKNVEITDRVQEENSLDFELLSHLLQVRKQLNEPCLEIVDLRFDLVEPKADEKMTPTTCRSFEEIAELLDLTAANARQRFKRCFDKLREFVLNEPELKEYFRS